MIFIKILISVVLTASLALAPYPAQAANSIIDDGRPVIRLATTTSTENSGLLGHLLPEFEGASGFKVHVVAVGTGKALRMGEDGDADALLVHAPEAEVAFVKAGHGINRVFVMYNDFVLVGPASNRKNIDISDDIGTALKQIHDNGLTFISRGDNSGTHKKELSLWKAIDIRPKGTWYREVGQGMGRVLLMASELDAFTIADRGTWLAYHDKTTLQLLTRSDPQLYNPYHIIAVNPSRHPDVNYQGAMALIAWIRSPAAQSMIGAHSVNDAPLFKPSSRDLELSRRGANP